MCYACAWIVVSVTLGRFDLQPEDAGFGFDSLVIRAGLVAAVVLLAFGGVLMSTIVGDWLRLGRRGALHQFHAVFSWTHLAFFVATIAALYSLLSVGLRELGWIWHPLGQLLAASVCALLITAVEGLVFLGAVGYSARHPSGPGLATHLSPHYVLATASIWILLAFSSSAATGSLIADRLEQGKEVDLYFFNFAFVEVAPVRQPFTEDAANRTHLDGEGSANEGMSAICGLRLGENASSLRLYLPDESAVLSLPTGSVTVRNDMEAGTTSCSPE